MPVLESAVAMVVSKHDVRRDQSHDDEDLKNHLCQSENDFRTPSRNAETLNIGFRLLGLSKARSRVQARGRFQVLGITGLGFTADEARLCWLPASAQRKGSSGCRVSDQDLRCSGRVLKRTQPKPLNPKP